MTANVFTLFVVFVAGEPSIAMGHFHTLAMCQAAAQAYANASCKSEVASGPIYGSCWGCMYGCTADENIKICGIDPRPKR